MCLEIIPNVEKAEASSTLKAVVHNKGDTHENFESGITDGKNIVNMILLISKFQQGTPMM